MRWGRKPVKQGALNRGKKPRRGGDTTAPSVPTGLNATAVSTSQIDLTWNAATDVGYGVADYRVFRDGAPITTRVPTSYSDTGLSASTLYTYNVTARDTVGNESAQSSSSQATTQGGGGGSLVHGQPFTVPGTGFGTKATAGPLVRDVGAAAANTIDPQWSGAHQNSGTTDQNLLNRNNGYRSITPPHSFVSRFMAGLHYQGEVFSMVGPWKDFTRPSFPFWIYQSYYFRVDPNWNTSLGSPSDHNFKHFNYTRGGDGLDSGGGLAWYVEYANGAFSSSAVQPQLHVNDDVNAFDTPNNHTPPDFPHGWYGDVSTPNPITSGWLKFEIEVKMTNAAQAGLIRAWVNNVLSLDVPNRTDNGPGTDRSVSIGSYARHYPGPNQYRYYADAYVDVIPEGPLRLVLANNAVIANATIIEPQVCSIWTNNSITATCWKGNLASGNVWAFVHKADGTWSSGTALTMT